jgi:hemerythrin-like domain-containing protein
MPVQIGAPRESSFNQPFQLLSDCHRRVEMFLGVLGQLARSRPSRLNQDQTGALERALDYFRDAAPKHTADEEESVFPRLRGLSSPQAGEAVRIIEKLESHHVDANLLHRMVDTLGRKWLGQGTLDTDEMTAFAAHVSSLESMYREHIALEDQALFPLAETLLSPETAAEIGREMAERRRIR